MYKPKTHEKKNTGYVVGKDGEDKRRKYWGHKSINHSFRWHNYITCAEQIDLLQSKNRSSLNNVI